MSLRYKGAIISATPPTTTGGDTGTASGAWTTTQQMQAQAAGNWPSPPPPLYIEDVFSTWLYTGTGATQSINNGIDLSGKGGMLWIKCRNVNSGHSLFDTARGASSYLVSNTTAAAATSSDMVTSFNSNGFTLGNDQTLGRVNFDSSRTYASWTFREQPKFFDIVTYTGDGTNLRNIPHNLGTRPGFIVVKRTDGTGDWFCGARSTNSGSDYVYQKLKLNSTVARAGSSSGSTDTTFNVGAVSYAAEASTDTNINGATYVAYLFAHNAGGFGAAGTDNVISCGSFTTDANSTATVNLGYEPQYLLIKNINAAQNWRVIDIMRGLSNSTTSYLFPNVSDAEADQGGDNNQYFIPNATGFSTTQMLSGNATYIYIAIRRPMKTPTNGTKVFMPVTYTGNNTDNRLVTTEIITDMTMARGRVNTSAGGFYSANRLMGNYSLGTASTAEENFDPNSFMTPTVGYGNSFSAMNGFGVGNDGTRQLNQPDAPQLAYAFQRAPGFFDVVCYTGTGSARTVAHNLGVAPEMMIVKGRNLSVDGWPVYAASQGANKFAQLSNTDVPFFFPDVTMWNNTTPTSSVFSVGTQQASNGSGINFVAYLFATLAGVSKVGSYTGTGTTQQINCGFTSGARFVMIKRADASSGWYVWDSARGIVAGNDPYLLLNSSDPEVTNTDYVDTFASGFEITSTAPDAINANGGSFIYLAIA